MGLIPEYTYRIYAIDIVVLVYILQGPVSLSK